MSKIAVMVSGGLDSFCAYAILRHLKQSAKGIAYPEYSVDGRVLSTPVTTIDEVVPVFVQYGQPYEGKEVKAVEKLFTAGDLVKVSADLATSALNNVPTVKAQVIQGRNILMSFYGSLIAPVVFISSLETEMTPLSVADKHPAFYGMASQLYSYSHGHTVTVTTPFSHLTKSKLIAHALSIGVTADDLRSTVSCYDETAQNCGACSTCFKRWIAMTNNDIEEDYKDSPVVNEYGLRITREMRQEYKDNKYSGRFTLLRMMETHTALVKAGLQGILV